MQNLTQMLMQQWGRADVRQVFNRNSLLLTSSAMLAMLLVGCSGGDSGGNDQNTITVDSASESFPYSDEGEYEITITATDTLNKDLYFVVSNLDDMILQYGEDNLVAEGQEIEMQGGAITLTYRSNDQVKTDKTFAFFVTDRTVVSNNGDNSFYKIIVQAAVDDEGDGDGNQGGVVDGDLTLTQFQSAISALDAELEGGLAAKLNASESDYEPSSGDYGNQDFGHSLYFYLQDGVWFVDIYLEDGGWAFSGRLDVETLQVSFSEGDDDQGEFDDLEDDDDQGESDDDQGGDDAALSAVMVKNIVEDGYPSNPKYNDQVAVMSDKLYFVPIMGDELWSSDGTNSGTKLVKDINPGDVGSDLRYLTVFDDKLFFSADDSNNGRELWISDGTDNGTKLVKDINPGNSDSDPRYLTAAVNKLYFTANNPQDERQIWVSDGTDDGTHLVEDNTLGDLYSDPKQLTVVGDKLFFTANSDGVRELWIIDATGNVTNLGNDITQSVWGSAPHNLTAFGDKLFFSAEDSENGRELWISDGTAEGTKMLKNINDGAMSSYPSSLTLFKGNLYFSAYSQNHDGDNKQLWKSDGTPGGTIMLAKIEPKHITVANDKLYFRTKSDSYNDELWESDGTQAGTQKVVVLSEEYPSWKYSELMAAGDDLYFNAYDYDHGFELWKSDGTSEGTAMFQDIYPGDSHSNLSHLTLVGNDLFFWAIDGENGGELWMIDDVTGA